MRLTIFYFLFSLLLFHTENSRYLTFFSDASCSRDGARARNRNLVTEIRSSEFEENYSSIKIIGDFYRALKPSKQDYKTRKIYIDELKIIDDTFREMEFLKKTSPSELKKQPIVFFKGSIVCDRGGVFREWVTQFSSKVFNPKHFKLFRFSHTLSDTVEISPTFEKHLTQKQKKDRLQKFKLLGLFTAFAIYHQCLLNVRFSIPFLKGILKKPVLLSDIKQTDVDTYNFLQRVQNEDPVGMNLNFTAQDPNDRHNSYNLKQLFGHKKVTNKNKQEYIKLLINWKYEEIVKNEMSEFNKGLRILISDKIIKMLDVDSLRLIISGKDKIDVKQWKGLAKIDMSCFGSERKQLVDWFWEIVESYTNKERSKLLEFVTGVPHMPAKGTQPFKFEIWCNYIDQPMIKANACENRLVISKCLNKDDMKIMLSAAILSSSGFNTA